MYRNLTPSGLLDQTESQHKDAVISSLKKELFELKDLEHDFLRLNDEVATIESKYALLLDEKERAENEHKIKMDINKKAIGDLRSEIDNLKIQIHKVNLQVEDTLRENSTLKRMCENRELEITSLVNGNRELEKSNDLQQEENKNLAISVPPPLFSLNNSRKNAPRTRTSANASTSFSTTTLPPSSSSRRRPDNSSPPIPSSKTCCCRPRRTTPNCWRN